MNAKIDALVEYGVRNGLLTDDDRIVARNRILEILAESSFTEQAVSEPLVLEDILKDLLDYACQKGLIEDNVVARDLFDTRLMGAITPFPREVRQAFFAAYQNSPEAATDYFYRFSCKTDYIRMYRVKKDLCWKSPSPYGELDITINLSKPEKPPVMIAASRLLPASDYPKCLLCVENEGYAGGLNHPARQNHRIIPLILDGEAWQLQYSPYVYYNEHCIVFNAAHVPMVIDRKAFQKILDFVTLFPHYFVGSNADLPIVGGSILSHEHFQGGRYEFPMAKANIEQTLCFRGFEDVTAGIVRWPMSVIRLQSEKVECLVSLADRILSAWRGYTDEAALILAETDGEPHNTITPIARRRDGRFELDLVLRNNLTTKEHPLGVYHPHAELHHIKKENIGLIEVMGLAVLPPRLKTEISLVQETLLHGGDLRARGETEKHADWAEEIFRREMPTAEQIDEVFRREIGLVFAQVLEHAGVFKCEEAGRAAFRRFVEYVNRQEATR